MLNHYRFSLRSGALALIKRYSTQHHILNTLDSSDSLDAFPEIAKYVDSKSVIPPPVMTKFYEVIRKQNDPLLADIFIKMVTVQKVGAKHFPQNVDRVISLYLQHKNWEVCIAFIREIELANNGNHVFSYDTLESLLISAKYYNDVDIAFQLIQQMHSAYPNVYGRTWGLFAQLVLKNKHYDALKWLHKHALVPGLLVLDDSSYMTMAKIAALFGDLQLAEWAALRMRRRQRALETGGASTSLQMYLYLIEAASQSSIAPESAAASIKAVCRYLVRLGTLAASVTIRDLPQTLHSLQANEQNNIYMREIFDTIINDISVTTEVKTLIFNLLLAANQSHDGNIAQEIIQKGAELNEDSVVLLLQIAANFNSGRDVLESIALKHNTPRVRRAFNEIIRVNKLT